MKRCRDTLNYPTGISKVTPMQCSFTKPNKQRCGAKCVTDSEFCFFHDPDTREEHHEATVRGGKERLKPGATLPPDTPDLPLRTSEDVRRALEETYNGVRCGRLAVNVGNCLAVIAQALIKAVESSDVERRLAAVEERQAHQLRQSA